MISLNGIQSILTIISTKCIDILFVYDSGRKGTFTNVHGGEVLPLVGLDVIHFARV